MVFHTEALPREPELPPYQGIALAEIVQPQTLYRRAHHRPRLGTLTEIGAG